MDKQTNLRNYFTQEWKEVEIQRNLSKDKIKEDQLFNSKIKELIILHDLKESNVSNYINMRNYEEWYEDNLKLFISNNDIIKNKIHIMITCYLNILHGGRLGFIHGASSYMLTFLSANCLLNILNKRKNISYIISSQKTSYKKKIYANSGCISEARLTDDKIIEVQLKDSNSDVCVLSIFYLELDNTIKVKF